MKRLLLYGMICFFSVAAFAQDNENEPQPNGARLQALKIAYITKKLNLTPEEAQKFWPVYNQYEAEVKKARQDGNEKHLPVIDIDEAVLGIRKRYNGEFIKALGIKRADDFFKAEKQFGVFVNNELIQRRQNRLQQRRPLFRQ